MHICSICQKDIDNETPTVLTMGRSMTPRYICEECEALLDEATHAREVDACREAIGRLGDLLAKNDCEDGSVISTVSSYLEFAKARAEKIEEGTYDFSIDEKEDEEFEISEDLMETEEDRELDRIEQEKEEKLNTFLNWSWVGVGIGIVAYLVWLIFFK